MVVGESWSRNREMRTTCEITLVAKSPHWVLCSIQRRKLFFFDDPSGGLPHTTRCEFKAFEGVFLSFFFYLCAFHFSIILFYFVNNRVLAPTVGFYLYAIYIYIYMYFPGKTCSRSRLAEVGALGFSFGGHTFFVRRYSFHFLPGDGATAARLRLTCATLEN